MKMLVTARATRIRITQDFFLKDGATPAYLRQVCIDLEMSAVHIVPVDPGTIGQYYDVTLEDFGRALYARSELAGTWFRNAISASCGKAAYEGKEFMLHIDASCCVEIDCAQESIESE